MKRFRPDQETAIYHFFRLLSYGTKLIESMKDLGVLNLKYSSFENIKSEAFGLLYRQYTLPQFPQKNPSIKREHRSDQLLEIDCAFTHMVGRARY